mgnify:CR=1 FL=1
MAKVNRFKFMPMFTMCLSLFPDGVLSNVPHRVWLPYGGDGGGDTQAARGGDGVYTAIALPVVAVGFRVRSHVRHSLRLLSKSQLKPAITAY